MENVFVFVKFTFNLVTNSINKFKIQVLVFMLNINVKNGHFEGGSINEFLKILN